MVTCTPRYRNDEWWRVWWRSLWLFWDEYASPWGPKLGRQYIDEFTRKSWRG